MSPTQRSLFLGSFVHCKSLDKLETWHNAAVFVDENGVIVAIEQDMDLQRAKDTLIPRMGWVQGEYAVHMAKKGGFFFPGFIGRLTVHHSYQIFPRRLLC
jgi:guanine deaminase